MADFSVRANTYWDSMGFDGVLFGADAPLLEVELNEMQDILRNKIDANNLSLRDCILNADVDEVEPIGNGKFNVALCPFCLSLGGKELFYSYFTFSDVGEGESIFVGRHPESYTLTKDSVVNLAGSTKTLILPNYLQDSRIGAETTRRESKRLNIHYGVSAPSSAWLEIGKVSNGQFFPSVGNMLYTKFGGRPYLVVGNTPALSNGSKSGFCNLRSDLIVGADWDSSHFINEFIAGNENPAIIIVGNVGVSSPILVNKSCQIIGIGNAVIKKNDDFIQGITALIHIAGATGAKIAIKDIKLDGMRTSVTTSNPAGISTLGGGGFQSLVIDGVSLVDFDAVNYAIEVVTSSSKSEIEINRVFIDNLKKACGGIFVSAPNSIANISRCRIYDTNFLCAIRSEASRLFVERNYIQGCVIAIQAGGIQPVIAYNSITNNFGDGITITCNEATVQNNVVDGMGASGSPLTSNYKISGSRNTVMNNRSLNAKSFAINVTSGSNNVVLLNHLNGGTINNSGTGTVTTMPAGNFA